VSDRLAGSTTRQSAVACPSTTADVRATPTTSSRKRAANNPAALFHSSPVAFINFAMQLTCDPYSSPKILTLLKPYKFNGFFYK